MECLVKINSNIRIAGIRIRKAKNFSVLFEIMSRFGCIFFVHSFSRSPLASRLFRYSSLITLVSLSQPTNQLYLMLNSHYMLQTDQFHISRARFICIVGWLLCGCAIVNCLMHVCVPHSVRERIFPKLLFYSQIKCYTIRLNGALNVLSSLAAFLIDLMYGVPPQSNAMFHFQLVFRGLTQYTAKRAMKSIANLN